MISPKNMIEGGFAYAQPSWILNGTHANFKGFFAPTTALDCTIYNHKSVLLSIQKLNCENYRLRIILRSFNGKLILKLMITKGNERKKQFTFGQVLKGNH